MRPLLAAAVALVAACSSCAPQAYRPKPARCTTSCGLWTDDGNCIELQELETDVVKAFDRYVDTWEEPRVCSALFGWEVFVHVRRVSDDVVCRRGWRLDGESGFCVLGYTHQAQVPVDGGYVFDFDKPGAVEVIDTDWRAGALAHELVHVMDLTFYRRAGHCNWTKRGVSAALKAVTGNDDPNADVCEFPDSE